jgi:hypothetical protein
MVQRSDAASAHSYAARGSRETTTVFQPVGVFVFLLTMLFLGGIGTIAPDTLSLFLIGLPAVALGTWTGLKLFGRLNETAFRRVVLVLLLASGIALLIHLR